eukprot:IDg2906t1
MATTANEWGIPPAFSESQFDVKRHVWSMSFAALQVGKGLQAADYVFSIHCQAVVSGNLCRGRLACAARTAATSSFSTKGVWAFVCRCCLNVVKQCCCFLSASFVVLMHRRFLNGRHEFTAAFILIGCGMYQQLIYGRHSVISSGNTGFLLRNLCMTGTLLLVSCRTRIAAVRSALPVSVLGLRETERKRPMEYVILVARVLLVMLSFEVFNTLGTAGMYLSFPVILAVLFGYKLELSGSALVALYVFHNTHSSAFWESHLSSHTAHIMRYEFFQVLSITSGLVMLVMSRPGTISTHEIASGRLRPTWPTRSLQACTGLKLV